MRRGAPQRGAVMKLFLLGVTGNAGRRILKLALQRQHEVTAFVRNEAQFLSRVGRPVPSNLRVSVGEISKSAGIDRMMIGHDVVINAAGNVMNGSAFSQLVRTVIDATTTSL